MRRTIAGFLLLATAAILLAACADKEAHVMTTPVPPAPRQVLPSK